MIRNKQWMQADLRDLVCEFAVRGEVASAMMLLRCLADMGACNNTASFTIVKSMLQGGRSCLDVMATAKELVEMGFTQVSGLYMYMYIALDCEAILVILVRNCIRSVTGLGETKLYYKKFVCRGGWKSSRDMSHDVISANRRCM